MSKASYTLLRNSDGTFRVEIPFNGRISVHQTKTKDRAAAEKAAKYRLKRLPIEDRAHKKFRAKKAKRTPPAAHSAPAPAPPIDAAATAAKLRALPVSSVAGDVEPKPSDPPPQTPAAPENEPAPASTGEAPPAPVIPEIPDPAAADEPIHPEIGDDRQPDDGERESQEFFADVVANAVVVGTVKLCHDYNESRGKVSNEPSPKGLEWYTEGLQYRARKLMGDASMGPNAKLLIGGGAVILSMLWGAADKPGAAAGAGAAAAAPSPRAPRPPDQPPTSTSPAPAQQPTPGRHPGADQGGDAFDEMALVALQKPRNGTESASGRFR